MIAVHTPFLSPSASVADACDSGRAEGHRPELEAFQRPHVRSSAGFPECEMLAIRSRNRPADRHLCILEYCLGPSLQVTVQQSPFSCVGIGARPNAAAVRCEVNVVDSGPGLRRHCALRTIFERGEGDVLGRTSQVIQA